MKKGLLFILAVAAGVAVSAQDIKFGAVGGLNYSIISNSVDPEPEGYEAPDALSGVGFYVGGFANIGLTEKISVQPELHFSVRGTKDSEETSTTFAGITSSTKYDVTYKDTFIEIPILLDYKLADAISLQVGPAIGLRIGSSAKGDITSTLAGVETKTEIDSTDDEGRAGLELGLAVGLGFNLTESIGGGVRYTRGLTDINEENEFEGVTFKNNYNVIQLFVAYSFGG